MEKLGAGWFGLDVVESSLVAIDVVAQPFDRLLQTLSKCVSRVPAQQVLGSLVVTDQPLNLALVRSQPVTLALDSRIGAAKVENEGG